MRVHLCLIGGASLCAAVVLLAQQKPLAPPAVSVPFVGCPSDGQVGPVEAPRDSSPSLPISAEAARKLAYYRSAHSVGVLAPRGWYCFGTYGSAGDTLYVSPEPIDPKTVFSPAREKFRGPAIQVSHSFGDTSGRYSVAAVIARVFPEFKEFVTGVVRQAPDSAPSFASGPYPGDTLTYRSKTVVEYRTAAQTDGLGTDSWLEKNDSAIAGVAMLIGPTPDLLQLAVRLPRELSEFTPAIVSRFQHDAADLRH